MEYSNAGCERERESQHDTIIEANSKRNTAQFSAPADAATGFGLVFRAALPKTAQSARLRLLEISGVVEVDLRQLDKDDNDTRLNYCHFKMPDGTLPVLEATLLLSSPEHPDWKRMTVGFPLACLDEPHGEHEFELAFTGVRWELRANGELMDVDFPVGMPEWKAENALAIEPEIVRSARLRLCVIARQTELAPQAARDFRGAQYWTPRGFNTWVGDVVTHFHNGRYHLFYLLDRRHHSSKFGNGGHCFEHISTTDFKTWTEHETAVPIETQWESVGTGTAFVDNGRLCLAYGLHTERFYPLEQTTLPAQEAFLQAHGRTGAFDRDTPDVPIGSTYSISADGVSAFSKTWKFFHPCRNPSVYNAGHSGGPLWMFASHLARGTWESASIDGGWSCVNPVFPLGGDCTFFFNWGDCDYVIGGFKNMWSKPAGASDAEYADLVSKGLDIYDGLNVPCVTEIAGGRFILAGWTSAYGWGGHLALRELVQFSGGRLGSKWMPELVPPTAPAKMVDITTTAARADIRAEAPANTSSTPTPDSFLLAFAVEPDCATSGGCVAVDLRGSGETCRFEICLATKRAQFAAPKTDGTTERQKSLLEGGAINWHPQFAIENLLATDRKFSVRLLVKFDPKAGGTLIDAEIANCRTMIGFWPKLRVKDATLHACDAANLSAATLAKLVY